MRLSLRALLCTVLASGAAGQDIAVHGRRVHTLAGDVIREGVVLIQGGKIRAVGRAGEIEIPPGWAEVRAEVVTPGLIDAHTALGLKAGEAGPAFDPGVAELAWVRSFGVTVVHTREDARGLRPSLVAKTWARRGADPVLLAPAAVGYAPAEPAPPHAREGGSPSPVEAGGGSLAPLEAELARTRSRMQRTGGLRREGAGLDGEPVGPLELVLRRQIPLMITAHSREEIAAALRIAQVHDLRLVLDGATEAWRLIEAIRVAGVPIILHPATESGRDTRGRPALDTAASLRGAGIPVALQSASGMRTSGTRGGRGLRAVLFEAGAAARLGLGFREALSMLTLDAAAILGVGHRIGSLEPGKDGDLALFDGDPLAYATHCTAVVIEGTLIEGPVQPAGR